MSCRPIDWEKFVNEDDSSLSVFNDPEMNNMVTEDLVAMEEYAKKAPKRRATPPWGLHIEIIWMLLSPNYRINRKLYGIGYGGSEINA